MADNSQHGLAMSTAEVTWGTVPAVSFNVARHTSCSLGIEKEGIASEEVYSDRQLHHLVHGFRQVQGDIGVELSFPKPNTFWDNVLEGLLGGTWSGDTAVAGTPGTTTDTLQVGTTQRSYTIERYYSDLESGNKYHYFTGCGINSLSLTFTSNAIVNGTVNVMAKDGTIAAASQSTGAYTAASTYNPFISINGTVNIAGGASAIITEGTINIANGLEAKPVIGDNLSRQHSVGRCDVTGSVTAYFESNVELSRFLNEESFAIEFEVEAVGDVAADTVKLKFAMPNCIYTGGKIETSGVTGAIVLPLEFTAKYDSTDSTLEITRTYIDAA